MELLKEAQADFPWIQSLRRQIHRHPEHGNQEFKTAALIEETLTGLGLKPRRLLDTAVVCDIEGAAPATTSTWQGSWARPSSCAGRSFPAGCGSCSSPTKNWMAAPSG